MDESFIVQPQENQSGCVKCDATKSVPKKGDGGAVAIVASMASFDGCTFNRNQVIED